MQSKRAYNSTRRQEQARQTRRQIAGAARALFIARGYSGATVEAIAQEAGVAPETVYATFGSKPKLLAFLMDIAVGGDEAPVTILERPDPQAVLRETDQHRQLHLFARSIAAILARAAPIWQVMRMAAKTEPEIAALVQRHLAERRRNMGMVARAVAGNGPLRPGVDLEQAGDTIWTLTSQEVYLMTTADLGWAQEQYAAWLEDALARLLLP